MSIDMAPKASTRFLLPSVQPAQAYVCCLALATACLHDIQICLQLRDAWGASEVAYCEGLFCVVGLAYERKCALQCRRCTQRVD
jgi:hypothetical protein